MKEFEKQWNCGMLSGSPSSFNSGVSIKEAAQFNWRAALKCMKEKSSKLDCEITVGDIEYFIDDELEE